jgi:hypothetical protein
VSLERTFAIIKPDAVKAGQQGDILSRIHKAGRSRRLLRGSQSPSFLRRTDRLHELRQNHRHGPGSRWRHSKMARHHGRHRPQKSSPRHHPSRPRHQHRQQLHSRLGRSRHRRLRNRLLLRRPRTHLSSTDNPVCALALNEHERSTDRLLSERSPPWRWRRAQPKR